MRSKNLNLRVPRLGVNRYGVFYVRSSDVDESGRRMVTQRSLGTKNPLNAKLAALHFCLGLVKEELMSDINKYGQNYEVDLSTGKVKADGPEDHARAMDIVRMLLEGNNLDAMMRRNIPQTVPEPSAMLATATVPQPLPPTELMGLAAQLLGQGFKAISMPTNVGISLREALHYHLDEEKSRVKSPRTYLEKKALYDEFSAFFGDVYLNQIVTQDITDRWRKAESKRPSQNVRRSVKAAQLAAKARGEQVAPVTLSLGRLEKRRGYLHLFFEWASEGTKYMHKENPMGQKVANKKDIRAKTVHHKEFTSEDLGLLFGEQYPQAMDKPDWYWLPLMSLYSGARQGEMASLLLNAFEVIDGIKVVYISDAKTESGRRTVPLHSVLLSLGLWEYVTFLKSKGESRFVWFRPQKTPGKSVGEQWGKWVDRRGITDDAKVFHSFRSTAITDMYNSDAPNPAAIRDGVGHSGGTKGSHGGYIRGAALMRVQATIESLLYPTVHVDTIRCKDPTFAAYYAEVKARQTSPKFALQQARRKQRATVLAERALRIEQRKARTTKS
jgi:integrase